MTRSEELLGLLIRDKHISFNQLAELKERAEKDKISIEELLERDKIVGTETLVKCKAEVYGFKYINLFEKQISEETLLFISQEIAENYKMICFQKTADSVSIAVTDPENFKALEAGDFLAKKEGLKAEYYLISGQSFESGSKLYSGLSKEVSDALVVKKEKDESQKKVHEEEGIEFEEVIKSAPVAKIVSVIMRHAVEGRASDIHIEPMAKNTRIRYRIDGILNTSLVLPKNVHSSIIGRIKVLANLKLDETRIPQDGRIREAFGGKEIDFRISILPLLTDEKVVMRILDVTKGAPALEDLGYMGPGLNTVMEAITKTDGMFLVTGPTGSGKSTTLFSVLNRINKEGINISTLEDPVEYFIPGVNQSQVRPEVGFSFASGLRSLLRQDPDVIMVGEIRDNETAELAIHASLTGHFVLSTLHTNDAIGAIPRFLDMNVEPFLLGSTLNCIIAQRLARKICDKCKEEDTLIQDDARKKVIEGLSKIPKKLIKQYFGKEEVEKPIFYKGKGCPHCGSTGYSGRVAIAEVLDVNEKLTANIVKGENITIEIARESQDFITMYEDGLMKILLGLTSYEEVLRVIQD